MTVTILIPTRGDRPDFLKHLLTNIIPSQTRQPDEIILVDREPFTEGVDIRERITEGVHEATGDLILIMEDDDWYSRDYIKTVAERWNGEDLIGIESTLYYHIIDRRWRLMKHHGRSSLFCTGIKREAAQEFNFGMSSTPFIDIDLWRTLEGSLYPYEGLAIGIKHGIGKTAGNGHRSDFMNNTDPNNLLKGWVDKVSFDFYCSFKKLQ